MALKKMSHSQPLLRSVAELETLSNDNETGVERIRQKSMHIMLMPKYLGANIKQGISKHLNKRLNTFVAELDGILIGYGKLYLSKSHGSLMNDSVGVHVDIVSDFWIFKPKADSVLKGIVSQKSLGHVSVLVHNSFNIACYCPSDVEAESWCGQKVNMGESVQVLLTKTDIKHGLPFMQGTLMYENNRLGTNSVAVIVNNDVDEPEEKRSNDSGVESSGRESKPTISFKKEGKLKAKKSKKRKHEEQEHNNSATLVPKVEPKEEPSSDGGAKSCNKKKKLEPKEEPSSDGGAQGRTKKRKMEPK